MSAFTFSSSSSQSSSSSNSSSPFSFGSTAAFAAGNSFVSSPSSAAPLNSSTTSVGFGFSYSSSTFAASSSPALSNFSSSGTASSSTYASSLFGAAFRSGSASSLFGGVSSSSSSSTSASPLSGAVSFVSSSATTRASLLGAISTSGSSPFGAISSSSLFGATTTSVPSSSMFDSASPSPLFGSASSASAAATAAKLLFGTSTPAPATSSAPTSRATAASSPFGATTASLFGCSSASTITAATTAAATTTTTSLPGFSTAAGTTSATTATTSFSSAASPFASTLSGFSLTKPSTNIAAPSSSSAAPSLTHSSSSFSFGTTSAASTTQPSFGFGNAATSTAASTSTPAVSTTMSAKPTSASPLFSGIRTTTASTPAGGSAVTSATVSSFSLPSFGAGSTASGSTSSASATTSSFAGFGVASSTTATSSGTAGSFSGFSISTKTSTPTTTLPTQSTTAAVVVGTAASTSAATTASSTSATTMQTLSLGVASTSRTTSNVSTKVSAAPKLPSEITGKTFEEIIREGNAELQERTEKFRKQAAAIAGWYKRILQNHDVLLRTEIEVAKVVETQASLERQLELIETHQQEVDKALENIEEEAERIYKDELVLLLDDEAASTRDAIVEMSGRAVLPKGPGASSKSDFQFSKVKLLGRSLSAPANLRLGLESHASAGMDVIRQSMEEVVSRISTVPIPSTVLLDTPTVEGGISELYHLSVSPEVRLGPLAPNSITVKGDRRGSISFEPCEIKLHAVTTDSTRIYSSPQPTRIPSTSSRSSPAPEPREDVDVFEEPASESSSNNTSYSLEVPLRTPSIAEAVEPGPELQSERAPIEVSSDLIGKETPSIRTFADYSRMFGFSPYELLEKLLDRSHPLPTFFEDFFSDKLEGVFELVRSFYPTLEGRLLDSIDLALRSVAEIRTYSFSCIGKDELYRSSYPQYTKYPPTEEARTRLVTLDTGSRQYCRKLVLARRKEAKLQQFLAATQEEICTLEAKLEGYRKEKVELEATVNKLDNQWNITDGCAKSRTLAVGALRDLLELLKELPQV